MIEGLYVGGIGRIEPEGKPTGIFKRLAAGPLHLGREGLAGDAQADRRVHGGPDKAVHYYAPENYARLATAFPEAAGQFVPGSIGENLSSRGWTEQNVCIGDIFRLGAAVVQVSAPRSPCWKIDRRYGVDRLSNFIADEGVTGWYYRVLSEGEVALGDPFELVERPAPEVPVARLWRAKLALRPDDAELAALLATPGLADGWRKTLGERREWLARHRGDAA